MSPSKRFLALVVGLGVTGLVAGGATAQTVVGVTPTEIKIGNTNPYCGNASAYGTIGKTIAAYFKKVNDEGGVNGRKINFISYDDAYMPPKTVEMVRKLVEQDQVAFVFQTLGTPSNTAIQKYLNQQKVPQLFVATGATKWNDPQNFPWTMGYQPNYQTEGRVYAAYALKNVKDPKIGILYQNDDYGKDYLNGFRAALGKKYADANIVAQEAVEATATSVASQMTRIRASGAKIFAVFQLPTPTVRTLATGKALGFNPDQIYMNSVAAIKPAMDGAVASAGAAYVTGILSIAYGKDPQDPAWDNDPAMKLYRQIIAKYGGGANPNDQNVYYGVAKAETFVQLLYRSGANPTRESFMKALLSMNYANKFSLPGVIQRTSRTDHFIISQMQLQRFNGTTKLWSRTGKLVEGRPR